MEDQSKKDDYTQLALLQMSGQQRGLYDALSEIHQNLADMYLGALTTISSNNSDRLAQAAHSLRELIEKLPMYIGMPFRSANLGEKVQNLAQQWKKVIKHYESSDGLKWSGDIDSHLRKFLTKLDEFFAWHATNRQTRYQQKLNVLRKLDRLGLAFPGPIQEAWVEQWKDLHAYFESVAHHRDFHRLEDFEWRVSMLEEFLLSWLRPRTFDNHTTIDELIKEGETRVSRELVQRVIAAIKGTADHTYFFNQLTSPNWLQPLREHDFFSSPPPREPIENTQYIRQDYWPESRYLVRMAAVNSEEVFTIVSQIPDSDNVHVLEDIVDVALAIPPVMAVALVPRMKKWLKLSYLSLLPEKIGALVIHLARDNQFDEAYTLASTLLTSLMNLPTTFDSSRYRQLLQEQIPALMAQDSLLTLKLLCKLLADAVGLSAHTEDGQEDYSYIWRPAIEDHEANRHAGFNELSVLLVLAVRDVAVQILNENKVPLRDIMSLLEKQPRYIFHRIALYLLYVFPDRELVAERLTDRRLFELPSFHHEYVRLAQKYFAGLPRASQEKILNWGNEPPISIAADQRLGESNTDQDTTAWRWEHFAAFSDRVPEELKSHYPWLNDLEPSQEAEFVVLMSDLNIGINVSSRIGFDALRFMSTEEIITILKARQPASGGTEGSSHEDIAFTLSSMVEADPSRFSQEAEQFRGVHPTYIYTLLNGFEKAIRQHRTVAWHPVLALIAWAVDQPQASRNKEAANNLDYPDWARCRLTSASLLAYALEDQTQELSLDLRPELWRILETLSNDPSPTQEYEASYYSPNRDPISLCRGTVRGEAMQAVICYALWVKRRLENASKEKTTITRSFDVMPEVQDVLDRHLDPIYEPSLAIRCVYGQRFLHLVYLDLDWTTRSVSKIFPSEEALGDLRIVAWDAYIIFCAPRHPVFDMLYAEYQHALERIGTNSSKLQHFANPDEHLAAHLMILYASGKLDEQSALLTHFFEKAPSILREYALKIVGQLLSRTEKVDPPILARFQALWQQRIEIARGAKQSAPDIAELSVFGWSFASGKFDDDWATAQLLEILKLTGNVEPDFLVVKRLAEISAMMPGSAVECLNLMVKGDTRGWNISGWLEPMRIILNTALQSHNTAHQKAVNLVHELGARGYQQFRVLLQPD